MGLLLRLRSFLKEIQIERYLTNLHHMQFLNASDLIKVLTLERYTKSSSHVEQGKLMKEA